MAQNRNRKKTQNSGISFGEKDVNTVDALGREKKNVKLNAGSDEVVYDKKGSKPSSRVGFFGFNSSGDESIPHSLQRRKKGNSDVIEKPIVRETWKSETAKPELSPSEVKARRKGLKEARRGAKKENISQKSSKFLPLKSSIFPFVQAFLCSVRSRGWTYFWSIVGVCCFIVVTYLKSQEEYFSKFASVDFDSTNDYYAALQVSPKATAAEIRTAYRQLSLRWHPDRNPNCEHCSEKIREISKAYSTLSDPQKRALYNSASVAYDALPSRALSLTSNNFYRSVLESQKIWVIQVYSDFDALCNYFAPTWETAVSSLEDSINFGRVNVERDSEVLRHLPLKIRFYPTVMLLVPQRPPSIFGGIYKSTVPGFVSWINDSMPDSLYSIGDSRDFHEFLSSPPPPGGFPALFVSANKQQTVTLKAIAYRWSHVCKIGMVAPHVIPNIVQTWGGDIPVAPTDATLVSLDPADGNFPLRAIPTKHGLPRSLSMLQLSFAPYLFRQNADVLCRSSGASRVYCLVLVDFPYASFAANSTEHLDETQEGDTPVASISEVLQLIGESKIDHEGKETAEGEAVDSEDEYDSESHIQVVQISTKSKGHTADHIPFVPPKEFFQFWKDPLALNSSALFLLDLDGHRFSKSVKATRQGLRNLYFTLDDGLLHFDPWPAGKDRPSTVSGAGQPSDDASGKSWEANSSKGSTEDRSANKMEPFREFACEPESFEHKCLFDFSRTLSVKLKDRIRSISLLQWGGVSIVFIVISRWITHLQAAKRARLLESLTAEDKTAAEDKPAKKDGTTQTTNSASSGSFKKSHAAAVDSLSSS